MTPIQVLSQLHSHVISAAFAWTTACEHLHEDVAWSAVLSHALKAQPGLHFELSTIFNNTTLNESERIPAAFSAIVDWMKNKSAKDIAPALAIWASQTQVDNFTIAVLIGQTSLSWKWDLALSLMPVDQHYRPEHQTLIHVLSMEHAAQYQTASQQVDPSILSSACSL